MMLFFHIFCSRICLDICVYLLSKNDYKSSIEISLISGQKMPSVWYKNYENQKNLYNKHIIIIYENQQDRYHHILRHIFDVVF